MTKKTMTKQRVAPTVSLFFFTVVLALAFACPAYAANTPVLTFTDSGIEETVAGGGYAISGTTLTVSSAGSYKITGTCQEGSIEVKKGVTGVTLVLEDLSLASSSTAPVVVKKASDATIHVEGTVTLANNEDPANETSEDATIADAFEGAAIKVKSGSTATFCGSGTLNIAGNAKNGIKGGAEANLVFADSRTVYNVSAANNGIAADNSVTIYGGTFDIDAVNDGIKSVPDVDDTVSAGNVEIYGGTFDIDVDGDGVQAETLLKIADGVFDVTTFGGYNASGFDKDTMSCKGIKASGDRDGIDNEIYITGGSFTLNCRDDAVHSDAYITVEGGTFDISTGDDGMHADTSLTLGTNGGFERDPEVTVGYSYEGLEGGAVYIYSGKHWVYATDDGVNAAGDSGSNDSFNPGGAPGRPGQQPGASTSSANYNIYIEGGDVYVNCLGDGLDANGYLYLNGGDVTVFSQGTGGDNSPFDFDRAATVKGATVFAAGTNPMNENPTISSGRSLKQTTSRSANTVVTLKSGDTVLYSTKLLRNSNYLLYVDPAATSNISLSTGGSVDPCVSDAWAHSWGAAQTVTAATDEAFGLESYTCSKCGDVEYKSIPVSTSNRCADDHVVEGEGDSDDVQEEVQDEGFSVTFAVDDGATVNVYHTQDYASADETGVLAAVSRNSSTGEPDSTGDGQVNFTVVVDDGYAIDGLPTVSGTYKNLKDVSTDELPNTYRVTKVQSDLTITVSVVPTSELIVTDGEQQAWVLGDAVTVYAQVDGLIDGEVVTAWTWEYSKDGSTWKKSGASTVVDGNTCGLVIPECTNARKPPMAWRATATTSLGRSAISAGQSLYVPGDLAVVPDGEFVWELDAPVELAAKVTGLDTANGETVASWQWYYSKDGANWKKTGAKSALVDDDTLMLSGFTCTQARRAPMAWSVRVTTSSGRTATSEGISLVG